MYKKIFLGALTFATLLLLVDCAADKPVEAPEQKELVAVFDEESIAFDLYYGEKKITRLGAAGFGAFYLGNDGANRRLSGPVVRAKISGGVEYQLKSNDGGAATIKVMRGAEGSLIFRFAFSGDRADDMLGASFQVDESESFYGLQELVVSGPQTNSVAEGITAGLDLRGQEIYLFTLPTISLYSPFFVSSAGWGAYVEGSWPGYYRFGTDKPNTVTIENEAEELAIQIFPGPGPMQVTERYARAIAPSILPPRWAFRPWRWRNDIWDLPQFYNGADYNGPYNSMVVEDILMTEALDIPTSLYWVDRPWGLGEFGYGDLEYDLMRLPKPVEMIDWLAGRDTQFMLWLAPWAYGEKMFAEASSAGYLVDNSIPVGPPDSGLIDLTNPDAVRWWQDYIIKRIADGVNGFKLDRGEEKNPDGEFFDGTYWNGRSYRELHNLFPVLYAKAVHDAFVRAQVDDFVVMPRSGWVGSQRYAIIWGGDTSPTELGLRSAIIAVQRAAVMNFPVWGSDTCGYGLAEREVCARWLAFSAFCPLMEVGPTRNIAPWSSVPEGEAGSVGPGGYNYEYTYDAEMIAMWSFYANLHDDLADYSYRLAELASAEGTPIIRPMIYAYPEIAEYKNLWEQYMYGPDILVAPVWRKGVESVEVSLPPGRWIDPWTGGIYEGPQKIAVYTPMHKQPIFVREGGSVELGDLGARWQAAVERASVEPDISALVAADPKLH